MNALLRVTVSLSLSGSLLILVLLAAKPLLRYRVSRRWQYYIWLLVIARLLLPFTLETSLMGTLFQKSEPVIAEAVPQPDNDSAVPAPPAADGSIPVETEQTDPDITQYLWVIWLGTALILFIRKITVYQSFAQYIRAGWEEVSDTVLLDRLAQTGEQMGVRRSVELYTNRLISSPLLLGILHPCIVLPAAGLPETDFQYTVRHELTHYKRRDILYKWLVQAALCIHWFNPLVWLMSRETERACELSCDEAVIRGLDAPGRRAYGDTLLHAAGAGGRFKNSAAPVSLSESGELLKERLEAIMNFKKRTTVTVLSACLTAVLLMGAAAAGAAVPSVRTLKLPENLTGSVTDVSMETLEFRGTTYYLVYSEAQLRAIGTGKYGLDKNYMQQADIRLSPEEWVPIGTSEHPFTGSYNGNGFEIIGLTMTDPDAEIIGLFGVAEEADLYNITLRDYDIQNAGNKVSDSIIAPVLAQGRKNFRYYDNYAYPKGDSIVSSDSAETCYANGNLPQFGTAFAALGQEEQKAFLEKIYGDGQIAYFSVALQYLNADSPLIVAFAEKAYTDGNISFFSVVSQHMSQEELASWQARAAADENFKFQAALFDKTGQSYEKKILEKKLEKESDRKFAEEYKTCGVTKSGRNYYYQGQLVNIFLDQRSDKSFCTLDMNPNGTVNIKILRDSTGKVTGAAYMTDAEVQELTGDMDDDSWDWDDEYDWDMEDDDWDWDDGQLMEAYKACGVTGDGKNYYYQNQLVNILLDHQPDSSYYRLNMNPNGTVNVKILRDSAGTITGAAYMTDAEVNRLTGGWEEMRTEIPIDIAKIKSGEPVWLGTYTIAEGDQVCYHVTAETGERLDIGFAQAGSENTDKLPDPVYNKISKDRKDGKLEVKTGAITWRDPLKPGEYSLFLYTDGGSLSNVQGSVTLLQSN
ncbi:MAG: M56 family metallopeptidase [Oscillospiraceae bacterium]|nr:M56 family metallopeptidase [Oscillospiraceae bacterium]